jgi:putative tricarboxylic transport membrane protein
MDVWQNLWIGFSTAAQPMNLLIALTGAVLGTITGILPGLGPLGAMSILLSFTLSLDATGAMILFAGIYYGAMYGGSTTSILLNIPGEAASVVTCIDGYRMAQKGRAGAALTISAVGSFLAGTISIFGLMVAASLLSRAALLFGPPEFFAIGVCGLFILVRLSEGPLLKSLIMVLLGLAVATVGLDTLSGMERFTFGIYALGQGVDFLPVAMGLFGIAEVLNSSLENEQASVVSVRLRELFPTRQEWKRSAAPALRGSVIGFIVGLIPGPSPVISTFVSYITEKKLSKHPEEFGHGAIEGVAGPEAANNAAVSGAYVPLLALGIPFTPAMAVILGALMLHGITPGPSTINEKPELFWGVIASMYVGNLMLLILNLPLIKVFVSILKIPKGILLPIIVVLCLVGVYSAGSSYVDLMVLAVFGLMGYAMRWLGFEPAPLVLAIVIGPITETALRQSLKMTGGSVSAMIFRPICEALYLIVILAFILPPLIKILQRKKKSAAGCH